METARRHTIRSAYDTAASGYAEALFRELDGKPLERKFLDLFFERVVNSGPVVEIGCGPGEIAAYLRSRGLETITGLDLSPRMIDEARRRTPEIPFQVGDVFALPFGDGTLSGVLGAYLIVNFSPAEVTRALREIARVLEPRGVLYLTFHCGTGVIEARDFFAPGNTLDFVMHDAEAVAAAVREAGFTLLEKLSRDPYPGRESPTVRCMIMATRL